MEEKAPLEDRRETHTICIEHVQAVRARWAVCQRSIHACRTPGEDPRDPSSCMRRVARSVVRLYVGLKRLAPKMRV